MSSSFECWLIPCTEFYFKLFHNSFIFEMVNNFLCYYKVWREHVEHWSDPWITLIEFAITLINYLFNNIIQLRVDYNFVLIKLFNLNCGCGLFELDDKSLMFCLNILCIFLLLDETVMFLMEYWNYSMTVLPHDIFDLFTLMFDSEENYSQHRLRLTCK